MAEQALIVIAERNELELVDRHKELEGLPILITGAGCHNVMAALAAVPRDTRIYNIGYAGSASVDVGTEVRIGVSRMWHTRAKIVPGQIGLCDEGATCCTSLDFVDGVDGGCVPEGAVFDMELGFIARMGFRDIVAYKTVSDRMDYEQYKDSVK